VRGDRHWAITSTSFGLVAELFTVTTSRLDALTLAPGFRFLPIAPLPGFVEKAAIGG
jgi:hypothetical protein